jgi:hypothetical protein
MNVLNPYALLAALLAFLAVGFGGYRYGYSRAEDAVAARVATAQEQAIAAANRDVEAATSRAVESAKAEAAARLSATKRRIEGERDAAIKARPECGRDAESMGLLQRALDSANGSPTATSSLSDHVPATPATSERH